LDHVEAPRLRPLQHARREVDPPRRPREAGDAAEEQPRAAADLEHVPAPAEALDEAHLQLVHQVVVAPGVAPVPALLVAPGERVVVGLLRGGAPGPGLVHRPGIPQTRGMKPGDHPDFYRLAPPPGASRESTIVLDAEGRFWHDGERVDHGALEQAL